MTRAVAPAAPTDAELMAAAQRGDGDGESEAFAALYRRHAPALRRYVYRQLRRYGTVTHWAIDDITAEAWLRAWRFRRTYRPQPGARVSSWLYTIVRNACRDYRRATTAPLPPVRLDAVVRHLAHGGAETVADTLEDASLLSGDRYALACAVRRAVAGLPEPQRRAMALRWICDQSLETTGQQLGIHPDAVKQRQVRAMRALRPLLAAWQEQECA